MPSSLPIYALQADFINHLRATGRVIITAPTGSGKSTQIPRMLAEGLPLPPGQRILVLQPRRLAARMLAERVAFEWGVQLGEEVGFQTRYERAVSARTKVLFITEGILTRLLVNDPALAGIAAIIFDEFHERSLASDLGLGMARHCWQTHRPDLRLVIMSATLLPGPLQTFLGDCPHLHAAGRLHPVAVTYAPPAADQGMPLAAAQALRRLLQPPNLPGDVLIFMPGGQEIRATAEECRRLLPGADLSIQMLYGDLPPTEQRQVMQPAKQRKIIIATNIAETSLTIPGVRHVIDSGLARVARYDAIRGVNVLETRQIARDSADQRAGRAGREGPGTCIRLWSEIMHSAKPTRSVPEVQRLDLAEAVLAVTAFGFPVPTDFPWLEPPAPKAMAAAEKLLLQLGLMQKNQQGLTELGKKLCQVPAHPRLALLLWLGTQENCPEEAALSAALLSEKQVRTTAASKTRSENKRRRQEAKQRQRSEQLPQSDFLELMHEVKLAAEAGFDHDFCRNLGLQPSAAREVVRAAKDLLNECQRLKQRMPGKKATDDPNLALLTCLLRIFPDRLARRRDFGTLLCELSERRLAELARDSVVRNETLFIAGEIREVGHGSQRGSKTLLTMASGVREQWLWDFFPDAWEDTDETSWDEKRQQVVRRQTLSCLGVLLEEKLRQDPDPEIAAEILARLLDEGKLSLPGWNQEVERWLVRVRWLAAQFPTQGLPVYDSDDLKRVHRLLSAGETSYKALRNKDCLYAVRQLMPHEQVRYVEKMAPAQVMLPSGRRLKLLYEPGLPPKGRARIQDLYDLPATPRVAGGQVPVLLDILAPNQRTVQITDDLKRFWEVHYPRIKPELSRRYPRHVWR